MNVDEDINNVGENTPASGLLMSTMAAASGAILGLDNSAAIGNFAGQETTAFQRFNNVSQLGIPTGTGRINHPGSEAASRPQSPFEDHYSLADVRSQWSFNGGFSSPWWIHFPETLIRIRKQNENFTKNGPPILEDNCTLLQFQDWQNELF
jgi:hypothetical protein